MPALLTDRIARSRVRIQHLDMVLKLIERGTVRDAARALGLTQPAVTKSLKELETLFGVPLFYRETKGLRPTPFCAPLERYARDAMYGLEETVAAVTALLRGEEGRVTVGAVPGRALTLLTQATGMLMREHPQIMVCVSADPSEELLRRLDVGELDFALATRSSEMKEQDFAFVPIGTEPLALVVAPDHPLLALQPVTVHDLAMHRWAMPPRPSPARAHIEQAFAQLGDGPPQRVVECAGALATLEFVLHWQTVGVMDARQAARLQEGGMVRVLQATISLQGAALGLVTLRRRRMRANAALVYRAVHEQIESESRARRSEAGNGHPLAMGSEPIGG